MLCRQARRCGTVAIAASRFFCRVALPFSRTDTGSTGTGSRLHREGVVGQRNRRDRGASCRIAVGQSLSMVRVSCGLARLDTGFGGFRSLLAGAAPRPDRAAGRQPATQPDRQLGRYSQHDGPARLGLRWVHLRHACRLHRPCARARVQHPALQRVHRAAGHLARHLGFRGVPLHRRPRHRYGTDGRHSAAGRGARRTPSGEDRRMHDDRRRARHIPGCVRLWAVWRLSLAHGVLRRRGASHPDRGDAAAHDGARAVRGGARTAPGSRSRTADSDRDFMRFVPLQLFTPEHRRNTIVGLLFGLGSLLAIWTSNIWLADHPVADDPEKRRHRRCRSAVRELRHDGVEREWHRRLYLFRVRRGCDRAPRSSRSTAREPS
jgi:hypothetical protein